jgi:hypothetical protein
MNVRVILTVSASCADPQKSPLVAPLDIATRASVCPPVHL